MSLLVFAFSASGQATISGPTSCIAGTVYQYGCFTTIAGTINICVSGGVVQSPSVNCSNITVGSFTTTFVNVIWNYGVSTGTVNFSSPSGSPSTTVTIISGIDGGTISDSIQHINYNTTPATLTCSAASNAPAGAVYHYQWQQSTNGTTFTNITNDTLLNHTFSTTFTSAIYYRRMVTDTHSGGTAYSNIASVFVYTILVPGSVTPATQTINYNTVPALLSSTGVSGGASGYTYQWQSGPNSTTFTNITGATASTYTSTKLTATTYFRVGVTSNGGTSYSSFATVTVNPQVLPGVATPVYTGITPGGNPGTLLATLASGGACGGAFTYQWQNSTDNISFLNILGATAQNYAPGTVTTNTYYRRKVTCGTDIEYTDTCKVIIGVFNPDMNYVKERTVIKPGVLDSASEAVLFSAYDVSQSTQYLDGLGRPIQTVTMQATPSFKDLVSFNIYDSINREAKKYLPYAATTSDGNYKSSFQTDQNTFNTAQYPGETYYYGLTNFEPSPLNRVSVSMAPGLNWTGASRGVSAQYSVNATGDSVQIWNMLSASRTLPFNSGRYPDATLMKNTTTDESGHSVVEYKDLEGHTILKKVQLAASPGTAHAGWLCTYYVYDSLSNLRFVIPPLAVQLVNSNWTMTTAIASELCFRYEYDKRRRMSIKKIPGAGETWMVYDARDRLVMTQDSALRTQQKWMFTKYDSQNRPDSSGLITDPTNYNNQVYYQNLDTNSIAYPVIASYTNELLTQTYYDDYTWAAGAGMPSTMATAIAGNSSYFITSYNVSPVYAVANNIPKYIAHGMPTGSKTKVLGTASQYLYAVSFYDDRGRTIQSQSINYTGAVDTATMQYDFSGKPLRSLVGHKKNGNTVQAHSILTKTDYDQAFRVKHIYKNIDNAGTDQLIDSMQYNELGQLKEKFLGNNTDSIVYDYNIRGWLTGINKSYVAGTANHFFGMELGYDKTTSSANGNTYLNPQYNGNIEGTVWKSAGAGINRKYDFSYDNVNRVSSASFLQNTTGSAWDNTTIDFSTGNMNYDANGNILTMEQKGFTVGGSGFIDQLKYTYQTNSNKLSQVYDTANNAATLLGDFHYPGSKGSFDYTYDGNGNMNLDNNKGISSIHYNYLNLPDSIAFTGKGYIQYVYDAGGNRQRKITVDNPASKKTVTTYMGGFVYQNTSAIAGSGTDTLQFIAHEEGRARWAYHKYTTGTTAYKLEYDFFEKDHLGNTRMVLTQQRDTSNYLASMEAAYRATESQLFANIQASSYSKALITGYPVDNTTSPNDSVARLNGSGQKSGPSLLLKVMSGDTVQFGVNSFYKTGTNTTTTNSFTDILNSLANGLVNTSGGAHGSVANLTGSTSSVYTGLTSFLGADDPNTGSTYPKAYLNWIFLDDQFNYVSSLSGAIAAGSSLHPAGQLNVIAPGAPLNINKNGYLYVWVSNETQGWDVFFDNLSVQHRQGPVLEENHYYPFGLSMAGISDKAVKTNYAENKYRYNKGSELQSQEFKDGSGLETYTTHFRELDQQLGRWWQIDPKSEANINPNTTEEDEIAEEGLESISPYTSMDNNPIIRNDPNGDCPICFFIVLGLLLSSEPAAAPSSNHNNALRDNQAINNAHNNAGIEAVTSLLPGGAKVVVQVVKSINEAKQDPSPTSKVVEEKRVPNPNGKNGGELHQKTVGKVENELKKDGYDKTQREVKVDTKGGNKDKRYVDIEGTNTKTGQTKQVQVGKQNKNGNPVARERRALDDIENATGKRPDFVPYNKQQ